MALGSIRRRPHDETEPTHSSPSDPSRAFHLGSTLQLDDEHRDIHNGSTTGNRPASGHFGAEWTVTSDHSARK